MAEHKALVLKDGKISQLESSDSLENIDYHSGVSIVPDGKHLIIREGKQMINFTMLTIDGDITIDGDLWLA